VTHEPTLRGIGCLEALRRRFTRRAGVLSAFFDPVVRLLRQLRSQCFRHRQQSSARARVEGFDWVQERVSRNAPLHLGKGQIAARLFAPAGTLRGSETHLTHRSLLLVVAR